MHRIRASIGLAALCLLGIPPAAHGQDLGPCLRGWDATQARDYAHALALYDECIREGGLDRASLARTYRNIGITYRRAGQPSRAVSAFDRAISLQPVDVIDDYIDRGNAHDEAGDFEQALADYAKALAIQPGYGEAYYNRGIAYEGQHRFDDARRDFITAYNHGLRTGALYDRLVAYGLLKGAP
jgi:tetratricopeptide (TPR) repeat protein